MVFVKNFQADGFGLWVLCCCTNMAKSFLPEQRRVGLLVIIYTIEYDNNFK